MAAVSTRIAYSRSSLIGQRFDALMRSLVAARTQAEELNRVVTAYGSDPNVLAADLGAPDASGVPKLLALLAGAVSELSGVLNNPLGAGAQTSTRQLTDAMA